MPSLQVVKLAFAASVLFCFSGLGRDGIASNPQPERTESENTLAGFLGRAAFKLDCYFTIEEMSVGEESENWMEVMSLIDESDPDSIEGMIKQLSARLKGVHVYRSKDNPVVVHIVDERLEKEKDYPLPKRVAVEFLGSPKGLVEKLHQTSSVSLYPKMGGDIQLDNTNHR